MNDLISNSFERYKDLKMQVNLDDTESAKETVNLDKFFEDVENVKTDMSHVEKLYKALQHASEEGKTVHSGKTMKKLRSQMDSDVEQLLKRVKIIKGKLEALERSNTENRKLLGCGPGSSADRTRTAVVIGLGKKLKSMMDDFQNLRAKTAEEYKEIIRRRFFTITGQNADEETVENLIASGESERILEKAVEEQGRGQIVDTISEIQERHDAVKELERSLIELHQIFLDMAVLVEAQGHQLNDIESHVARASSFVRSGVGDFETAKEYKKSSRKWMCIAMSVGAVLICIIMLPILRSLSSN